MKNFQFIDQSELVLTKQSNPLKANKNRTLTPDFDIVLSAFKDKQDSDYPLQKLDNLFVADTVEINIAADVQGIVLNYDVVTVEKDGKEVEIKTLHKAYKIIPEIVLKNGKETVKHIFKFFTLSKNQREIMLNEKVNLAKLSVDMIS